MDHRARLARHPWRGLALESRDYSSMRSLASVGRKCHIVWAACESRSARLLSYRLGASRPLSGKSEGFTTPTKRCYYLRQSEADGS